MSAQDLKFPKLSPSALARTSTLAGNRVQREMVAFDSGNLQPGEDCIVSQRMRAAYRGEHMVASLSAQWPERRFFIANVKGSRRRGRRASWLFDAATLCHPRKPIELFMNSLKIGKVMVGGTIPLSVFDARAPDLGLMMDAANKEQDITISFVNQERHRVARARVVMIGSTL